MITGKEICEYIASWIERQSGIAVTWQDVWEIDPNGELYPVAALYWGAMNLELGEC